VKTVGNSSRGRSQGVPKIFRAPMYMAHCAVIFAIAQLSCICMAVYSLYCAEVPLRNCSLTHCSQKAIHLLPGVFWVPLLSQERVKLRTSNFVGTFTGSIGTKAHENVGNSSRGRSQGVPKIFRAPMYRAHCAVIFAIAQLSCTLTCNDY